MDKNKVEKAIKMLLEGIGEDVRRKDIIKTPKRVAEMYEEILGGTGTNPEKELEVIFEKDHDEIILLKNIPLYSVCEHHLLPFIGKAHVAYLPDGTRISGLSKLARVVEVHATTSVVELISSPGLRLAAVFDGDDRPVSFQGGVNPPLRPAQGVL